MDGRRVIVTGGASGIGLAVAAQFLASGAHVGIVSRTQRSIESALAGPLQADSQPVHARAADVSDEEDLASAISGLACALGGLDTLVTSAGIEGEMGASLTDVTSEGFREVLDVNVLGVFHAVKCAVPLLAQSPSASVTMVGSDSGFVAVPGMLAYNASKGALVQLTRALSYELFDEHCIRVNSVCPSIVDTPMARRGLGVESFQDAAYPVNSPDDVARTVLFLSAPESRSLNGLNLLMDFGYTARSSFPA